MESINRTWTAFLIGGLLFAILGLYSIINPGIGFVTFGLLLGISLIYQGITEITYAVYAKNQYRDWGWILVYGIVSLTFGLYLLLNPAQSAFIVAYTVLFLIMLRSLKAIVVSIQMQALNNSKWWIMLLFGILGFVFSFYLFDYPIATAEFSVIWIGCGILAVGVLLIGFAISIKKNIQT